MGLTLRYFIQFCRNWPIGSWKEDFLKCFTINGHDSHLSHMTSIMLFVISLFLKASIQNLVEIGPGVSEKSKFKFL